jgi:hypothetical protein
VGSGDFAPAPGGGRIEAPIIQFRESVEKFA